MTAPHCDPYVLHAPTECDVCDQYAGKAQRQRIADGINFTGHFDADKQPDPASVRRTQMVLEKSGEFANGYEVLSRWSRNRPWREADE